LLLDFHDSELKQNAFLTDKFALSADAVGNARQRLSTRAD